MKKKIQPISWVSLQEAVGILTVASVAPSTASTAVVLQYSSLRPESETGSSRCLYSAGRRPRPSSKSRNL
jgi:hypothetical protein